VAKVNITQAAKLAGITRQHLHKKYINPKDKEGKPLPARLSVEQDRQGNPVIDTSELLRVFGSLVDDTGDTGDSKQQSTDLRYATPENIAETAVLQVEVKLLREQLKEYKDRESRYQSTIDRLTDTLKQLEHKPAPALGFWSRLFRGNNG
jgi:regulator of replication initiation timing